MTRPSRSTLIRVAVALLVGIAGGLYCYFSLKATGGPRPADDFTWHWLAARALIEGKDPYVVIAAGGPYQLDAPYVYPLTTAMAAVPFALFFSPAVAAATWIGCGSAIRSGDRGAAVFAMPYHGAAAALLVSLSLSAGLEPRLAVPFHSLGPKASLPEERPTASTIKLYPAAPALIPTSRGAEPPYARVQKRRHSQHRRRRTRRER